MKKSNLKFKTRVSSRALRIVSFTAVLLAACLFFTACPQKVMDKTKSKANAAGPVLIFLNESKIDFGASVQIAKASIEGKAPDYPLPGTDSWWKGVFIGGRKVNLSAYALSSTEVPYWFWKEVYDWAVKPENGYKFANPGCEGSTGTPGAAPTEAGKNHPVTKVSWSDCIIWCNA